MENLKNKTTEELVELFKNGNNRAFDVIFLRYRRNIFGFLLGLYKDKTLTQDATQDVFLKMLDFIKSDIYKEEGKLLSYMMRIGFNLFIDQYRRKKKIFVKDIDVDLLEVLDQENNMIKHSDYKEQRKILRRIAKSLSCEQREILVMYYFFNFNFREIAERKNVTINTIIGKNRDLKINLKKILNGQKI